MIDVDVCDSCGSKDVRVLDADHGVLECKSCGLIFDEEDVETRGRLSLGRTKMRKNVEDE